MLKHSSSETVIRPLVDTREPPLHIHRSEQEIRRLERRERSQEKLSGQEGLPYPPKKEDNKGSNHIEKPSRDSEKLAQFFLKQGTYKDMDPAEYDKRMCELYGGDMNEALLSARHYWQMVMAEAEKKISCPKDNRSLIRSTIQSGTASRSIKSNRSKSRSKLSKRDAEFIKSKISTADQWSQAPNNFKGNMLQWVAFKKQQEETRKALELGIAKTYEYEKAEYYNTVTEQPSLKVLRQMSEKRKDSPPPIKLLRAETLLKEG